MAQSLLFAVFALDMLMALLVATAPTGMGGGPMVVEGQSHLGWFIVGIGGTLHVAGIAWMIRILRTDPERHASFWRSQRR